MDNAIYKQIMYASTAVVLQHLTLDELANFNLAINNPHVDITTKSYYDKVSSLYTIQMADGSKKIHSETLEMITAYVNNTLPAPVLPYPLDEEEGNES